MKQVKIGIINCHTGKTIIEKKCKIEEARMTMKQVSRWFDMKDTFFSGKILWDYWQRMGDILKFEAVIEDKRKVATQSIVVFEKGNKLGQEYEFYIERI